ncbi:hypothetical protein ACRQET_08840, partial [Actinotignum sp. GS-2025c]
MLHDTRVVEVTRSAERVGRGGWPRSGRALRFARALGVSYVIVTVADQGMNNTMVTKVLGA